MKLDLKQGFKWMKSGTLLPDLATQRSLCETLRDQIEALGGGCQKCDWRSENNTVRQLHELCC